MGDRMLTNEQILYGHERKKFSVKQSFLPSPLEGEGLGVRWFFVIVALSYSPATISVQCPSCDAADQPGRHESFHAERTTEVNSVS